MTLEGLVDKIIPTLIVVVIMALFGMYIRIGYLEQTAKLSIERYRQDMRELKTMLVFFRKRVTFGFKYTSKLYKKDGVRN